RPSAPDVAHDEGRGGRGRVLVASPHAALSEVVHGHGEKVHADLHDFRIDLADTLRKVLFGRSRGGQRQVDLDGWHRGSFSLALVPRQIFRGFTLHSRLQRLCSGEQEVLVAWGGDELYGG